jgi:hypothetical protein
MLKAPEDFHRVNYLKYVAARAKQLSFLMATIISTITVSFAAGQMCLGPESFHGATCVHFLCICGLQHQSSCSRTTLGKELGLNLSTTCFRFFASLLCSVKISIVAPS